MVLGKLPVPGRPTILITVAQGPTALAVDAGRGYLNIFTFIYPFPPRGGRVVRRCWVNFQCRGVLLTWITVGQGPIVLAVGAGGGCLDIFSLIYHFSFLSPSLWETARYRLKYCLKGPLSPKPTNQPTFSPLSPSVWETGWCDGADKISSAGASYSLDYRGARTYCTCSRCGWGCLDIFTPI